MSRHRSGQTLSVLLFALLLPSAVFAADPPRPNVLFIVSDDLNTALGCYGHPSVQSPHIDQLAARGVRFDRAYCQFPLCNPSRTSFLTGRRPETTNVFGNGKGPRSTLGDVVMLPELFRNHGYFTARVGKVAHDFYEDAVRWDVSENPHDRAGRDLYPEAYRGERTKGGNFYVKLEWAAGDRADEDEPDGCIATRVVELLERHRDRPFFIAAGFYKPHLPFVAPRRYFDLYPPNHVRLPALPADGPTGPPAVALTLSPEDRAMSEPERRRAIAAYHACTTFMDAQVGRVLAALDRLKLDDRTVVVFVSDHGFHLGEHGGLWRKMTLFEESVRVPLIVRAPGKRAGAVSRRLVELVDLYPTLADLAGLPAPPGLEGTSFVPLLGDPDRPWKSAAFSTVTRFAGAAGPFLGRGVRTERYRFNDWGPGRATELYDLQADPGETVNLAADPRHADTAKRLRGALDAGWRGALPARDGSR